MKQTILALFALLFIASATTEGMFRLQRNTMMNALAGNNGSITLRNNIFTWSAPTDLKNKASSTNNLLLALYSSDTLLARNCLKFENYDCQENGCQEQTEAGPKVVSYLEFTANANKATAAAIVDYKHWSLNAEAPTYISVDCASQASSLEPYREKSYGIIGLGLDNNANKNFLIPGEKFALAFNYLPNMAYQLQFGVGPKKDKSVINTVKTDKNWQVAGVNAINAVDAKGKSSKFTLVNARAILDLNFDGIGFPIDTFKEIIKDFITNRGLQCPEDDFSGVNCTYAGYKKDLPTLRVVADGTYYSLPPSTYASVQNERDNVTSAWVYLKFTGLSTTLKGRSFVTPAFENTVVIGKSYLIRYYTLFIPGEQPKIEFYDGEDGLDILANVGAFVGNWIWDKIAFYVYAGGALLLVALLCCCFACCGCFSKKQQQPVYVVAAPGYNPPPQGFGQPSYGNPYGQR